MSRDHKRQYEEAMLTLNDFKNLEIKVAKIISAEPIEGSQKLLKLRISLGAEERQIVAGIGMSYDAESLSGREIVVVTNLAPRVIMGVESQGMLLAVSDSEGGPVLLVPDKEVLPGSLVR